MSGFGWRHWKILCRPDLNGGSEIPLIYQDLPLGTLDPPLDALDLPLSIFSGLNLALILFRAGLWIDEYTGFDLIFDWALD